MSGINASYDVPLQISGLLIRRKMTLSFCIQGCSCRAGVNHNLCWHRKEILEGSSTKLEQANASLEQSRQQARAYQARHKALKAQNLPYVAPIVGSLKGIVLVDKSKRVCDDRDTRGHYEGPSLVLLRSGQFVKLDESGKWSNWQDESSHWVNEVTEISDLDAIHQFGFAEIIKGMVEAFQDAKKKAEKKKGQLGSRLTQLTQIEMILKEEKQC